MRLKFAVIFAHVALLFLLGRSTSAPKIHSQPLAVHTYTLITPTPQPTATAPPRPTPKPKPQKANSSRPQSSEQPSKPDRSKLIGALKKSLASLETETTRTSVPSPLPSPLASETLKREATYEQAIAATLQNALTLPQSGDIRLEVTLTRTGALEKLQIKNATNSNNKTYVETTLPRLTFPPFGNNFRGEKFHTFVITLTSQ